MAEMKPIGGETNKKASNGSDSFSLKKIGGMYSGTKEWLKNIALIASLFCVAMLLKKLAATYNGTGDTYGDIIGWGVTSVVLMGYYMGTDPKPFYRLTIFLVSIFVILQIFHLSIGDVVEFAQKKYVPGSKEAKSEYRKAVTALNDKKLETSGNIAEAKSRMEMAIVTGDYEGIPAGTKVVIADPRIVPDGLEMVVKIAEIKNNKISKTIISFPYRLLQTDFDHYAEPVMTTKGFKISKLSDDKVKVTFYTDRPVNILEWKKGVTIEFVEIKSQKGIFIADNTDSSRYDAVPIKLPLTAQSSDPLILKGEVGGHIVLKSNNLPI